MKAFKEFETLVPHLCYSTIGALFPLIPNIIDQISINGNKKL